MADIVERTVLSVTDKRIVLGAEQLGRTISIGTNWNKIRIGMRCSTTYTSTSPLPLLFGLCSGTTAMAGDATPEHFVGVRFDVAGWGVTNYTGFLSAYGWACKIVDGTATQTGNDSTGAWMAKTANCTGALMLEITKGSPNFTISKIRSIGTTSGTPTYSSEDITQALFEQAMLSAASPPSIAGHIGQWASNTIAVNEATDGYLDTINIKWGDPVATLDINEIAWARLS